MAAPHRFDATILREYDVRGVVGKTLHAEDAKNLGRAFGTVIRRSGGSTVAVGRDGRLSSLDMENALVEGLASTGLTVKRVGEGATPMLYFATFDLKTDAGVQVTGSHNPPDYNGFKMMMNGGPVYGAAIQDLGKVAAAGDFEEGQGKVEDVPLFDRYVNRLLDGIRITKPLTVAWDAGNGVGGPVMAALAQRLPGKHILLNEKVDGTFPAHHPDPTVESNLVQLKAAVAQNNADIGIAFDGDADRIGLIDGRGRVIWGDQILALLSRPVLAEKPGSTIIADVKASQVLFDEVARLGGSPLMWNTGHSLIKKKMKETHSPLAGEMSGHIFFADRWYGVDDALYAALRVLELIEWAGKSIAELRDELPTRVNTPEMRFTSSDTRKFAVVQEVKDRLAKTPDAKVDATDGVRVSTADGWWLLRASNTQDVLVGRCEAADAEGLKRLQHILESQLQASGVKLELTGH
ncbi:phosphoglucomutase/phosphomannomutase PgmG [Lacibacterium aquatile]|uniref:Phosphoglucomutase/phosphomannomutase PgmG n=1 Tax=Lacibacterium aquatile TaxID=1168082 RepID=A0ABW5DX64_9PROT